MNNKLLFYLILATAVFAGGLHADAQRIEDRIQEGKQWIRENPWPAQESDPGWKLNHAALMAEADQQAAPLNQAILEYCQSYNRDPQAKPTAYHDPRPKPSIYFIYLKPQFNRLLSDEAKDAIEDVCWRWVYQHSFLSEDQDWPLNNPTKSVWLISGSENHCAAQRSANLLALQVLLQAGAPYGPRAKLHDGFTVEAHYREWVKWYQAFFDSRLRSGLNCEIAHPSSYGNSTINHYTEIFDLTDSVELKQAARDYLDIFWANVACEFEPRIGIRASFASTRCYKWSWIQSGHYWAQSLLYAYDWSDAKTNPNLVDTSCFLSEYRPPAIVRAIARDEKREPYLGTSRRFGRGSGWDRGVYDVLFDDDKAMNSYIRRDSWYTQAYTMSTISLDPSRDYIELVNQSRVMGVQFASQSSDRLVVYASDRPSDKKSEYKKTTSKGVNGMLGPDCMIVARDPNANAKTSNSTRIFISDGALWDNREENDGWCFTHAGDGYAAFLIAGKKGYDVVDSPYENGYFIEFKDIWAPVVIQMGQAKDYNNDFMQFKAAVKGRPLSYKEGKLNYRALNGDTYEYWSKSETLPKRNGKTIDLNPRMVYDFPYLKMIYGEGPAIVRYPGYPDLVVPANR